MLIAEGHVAARHYPVALVWEEAELCRRRINARIASESLLMKSCIGAVLNGKKGNTEYRKHIKELTSGG